MCGWTARERMFEPSTKLFRASIHTQHVFRSYFFITHAGCQNSQSINMFGYTWLHVGCALKALLKRFKGEGSHVLNVIFLSLL